MENEPTNDFERELWKMGLTDKQREAFIDFRAHQSYFGDGALLTIAQICVQNRPPLALLEIVWSVEDSVRLSTRERAQARSRADVQRKRRPGKYKWGG